jgi:hypothetical protein
MADGLTDDRLVLDIGGVVCQVLLPDPAWHAALAARYAPFLSSTWPDWRIDVRLDPALADGGIDSIEHTGAVTRFQVAAYAGSIDLDNQQAFVSTPNEARAASAIERVLSYVCMQMLPRQHHALWLHASGVVLDGSGYVFFGPSGAGKTTLARLARDRAEILSDENVIVRCGEDGPQLISTPFWGHSTPVELIRRMRRTVPLRALFALRHTPDFQLHTLSAAEAVVALLLTEKVATERVDSATAWLDTARQLVQQAPVYELSFAPTLEVWSFLEQRGLR